MNEGILCRCTCPSYFFILFSSSLPYSTLHTNGFVLIKQEIYLLLKNKGWMCGFCEGRKILQNDVVVVDTAKSTFWLHMDLVAIFIFCWVSFWILIILKNIFFKNYLTDSIKKYLSSVIICHVGNPPHRNCICSTGN